MPFEGVYAAIVCPMDRHGRVDDRALADHVRKLAGSAGMSGLLCNGHAGENHVLTAEEKGRILTISRKAAPDLQIIAGLNAETVDGVAAEARDAEAAGADAVMIFPPFSWALGHDRTMALAHHQAVLDASGLPLFLYQASIGAGRMAYAPDTLEALLGLPRIAGIKEGSWEFRAYEDTLTLARAVNPSVPVMASGDEHLFPCFALGTRGSIVSIASVIPDAVIALYNAVQLGALDTARRLHDPIQALARLIYGDGGSAAQATLHLKVALSQTGDIAGPFMRAPVPPVSSEKERTIRAATDRVQATMAEIASERSATTRLDESAG